MHLCIKADGYLSLGLKVFSTTEPVMTFLIFVRTKAAPLPRMSPLGNASADECADYCIVMFSDLTRKVTMQNLYHDGGFSSVGMSLRAMATYEKGLDEYKDENGNIIYG